MLGVLEKAESIPRHIGAIGQVGHDDIVKDVGIVELDQSIVNDIVIGS
jgi:hypothetical protein